MGAGRSSVQDKKEVKRQLRQELAGADYKRLPFNHREDAIAGVRTQLLNARPVRSPWLIVNARLADEDDEPIGETSGAGTVQNWPEPDLASSFSCSSEDIKPCWVGLIGESSGAVCRSCSNQRACTI